MDAVCMTTSLTIQTQIKVKSKALEGLAGQKQRSVRIWSLFKAEVTNMRAAKEFCAAR